MEQVSILGLIWVAAKFWILPALVIGALPILLESTRRDVPPRRRTSPGVYYLGAMLIGLLGTGLFTFLAALQSEFVGWVPLLIVIVGALWIVLMSRKKTWDPFLGAWCTLNGVGVFMLGFNVWDRPLVKNYMFPGIEYVAAWGWVGLPLIAVALIYWLISTLWRSATAPEIPRSDSAHQASGE